MVRMRRIGVVVLLLSSAFAWNGQAPAKADGGCVFIGWEPIIVG